VIKFVNCHVLSSLPNRRHVGSGDTEREEASEDDVSEVIDIDRDRFRCSDSEETEAIFA